jgi:hypothetical protein
MDFKTACKSIVELTVANESVDSAGSGSYIKSVVLDITVMELARLLIHNDAFIMVWNTYRGAQHAAKSTEATDSELMELAKTNETVRKVLELIPGTLTKESKQS